MFPTLTAGHVRLMLLMEVSQGSSDEEVSPLSVWYPMSIEFGDDSVFEALPSTKLVAGGGSSGASFGKA